MNFIDMGSGTVRLLGTFGANNLVFQQPSYKLTSFASSDLDLAGSITSSGGVFSGTVSSYSLISGADSLSASGTTASPFSMSFATLNSNNAANIMAAMLAGNDQIFGDGINQALDGFGGNDAIVAGDGNDTLNGGVGNDTLNGGAGVDEINGGEGNDVILIDAAAHHAAGETIDGGDGTADVIRFTATTGQSLVLNAGVQNVEQVVLTSLSGDLNINATAITNGLVITGNNGANVITGTGEADSLSGSGGSDELNGLAGNDTLNGGLGIDTMNGGDGDDVILLGSGEHPVGEAIDGGNDNDTIRFTATTAQTLMLQNVTNVENVAIATAAGVATGTTALSVNASSLTQGVKLTGNAGANLLIGGSGNDLIIGGAGVDNIKGGGGEDDVEIAAFTHFAAGEAIDGGAEEDVLRYTGTTAGTLTLTNKVVGMEDVVITPGLVAININAAAVGNGLEIFGNDGANSLTGTAFGDTISGGAGNDSITGGAGVDDLQGGAGDDTFVYASAAHLSASETVAGGADSDTVHFTATTTAGGATLTLGANFTDIEKVVIGTSVGIVALNIDATLAPNQLSITGNGGKNTLTGTGFGDTLIGGAGNDTLVGNAGQDTLNGGAGADNVQGGNDNDIVLVASALEYAGDAVNGGAGFDTLRFTTAAVATLTLNANFTQMEQVWIADATGDFSGTVAINVNAALAPVGLAITGNDGANVITGTAFADNLNGAGGNDVFLISAGSHHTADELIDGHFGDYNVIRFTGAVAGTLTLSTEIYNIHEVEASDAAGGNLGTAALNIDASAAQGFPGPGAFTLTGNAGANTLTGTANDDLINGNAGNDTLIGGGGADTLDGGSGVDWLSYATSPDVVYVRLDMGIAADGYAFEDTLLGIIENASGSNNNDSFVGSAGGNVFEGGLGNDSMEGRAGNDTLIGGAGEDIMNGEDGNDVFIIAAEADHFGLETIHGGNGTEVDLIRFSSTNPGDELVLTSNVTAVEQVFISNAAGATSGMTALHVNAGNVTNPLAITGNNGANEIVGTGSNDTINGNGGNDTLIGGAGNDVLNGGTETDTADYSGAGSGVLANLLAGTAARDGFTDVLVAIENVIGSANNDTLIGNAGNNILTGGGGNDSLNGGAGTDTADYSDAVSSVVVDLLVGSAELGAGNDSLALFENITGSAQNDTLIGNAGANVLDGGLGNDSMTGGSGNDTYFIDSNDDQVTENENEGTDTIFHRLLPSAATYLLASEVENLTILFYAGGEAGSAEGNSRNNIIRDSTTDLSSINLFGDNGNDLLFGGAGANDLAGGTGKDTLMGGAGDDVYSWSLGDADAGDLLVEGVNQGTDTVNLDGGLGLANFAFVLPVNIENGLLFNLGDKTGTLTGNTLNNHLRSIDGTAILNGGAGNDTLGGSDGNHDTLNGGTGNDSIQGFNGNDVLIGGTGVDSLDGGFGDDVFLYGAPADFSVGESVSGDNGDDRLRFTSVTAGQTLVLSGTVIVERVEITNAAGVAGATALSINASGVTNSLVIFGNNGANTLTGTAFTDILAGLGGNDVLVSGAGADSMDGGAGNDLFLIGAGDKTIVGGDGTADIVRFTAADGEDLVLDALDTGIEQVLVGSAAGAITSITQHDVDAELVNNALTITGNNGINSIIGTGFGDIINGNGGDDNLLGNAGNDTLSGGAENDTLTGGAGTDRLVGGTGDDRYQLGLADLADVVVEAAGQGTDEVAFNNGYNGNLDADLSYTLAPNIENASITNLGDHAGTLLGNSLNNLLLGNSEGDGTFFFDGGAGNDQLTTGGDISAVGADTLLGGAGNDTLSAGYGQDSVNGGDGNDRVLMQVSAGNADHADGGTGTSDTLVLSDSLAGGQVTVDLTLADQISHIGEGDDNVLQQKGFENIDASGMTGGNLFATGDTLANHLIGTGVGDTLAGDAGNDTLGGGGGIDILNGDAGNDSLDGGGGDDVMTGGAGNDTYRLDSAGDQVTEDSLPGSGVDTIIHEAAPEPYTLPDNVENLDVLLFTSEEGAHAEGNALNNIIRDLSSFANGVSLSGLAGNDLLIGGVGQNFLSGGVGKDTLMGGAGNDTYNWSLGDGDAGDLLIEAANQGTDNVNLNGSAGLANFAFVLPTNIENALLFNMGDKTGTLTGNVLNNGLSALNGTAIMNGGAGNDSLNGSGGNDTLTGGTGVDSILGGAGNDVFVIGAGAEHLGSETMSGGADFDVIRFISGVNGDKLILTNNVSDIEQVVIVTPAGSAAGTTTLEVNAAAAADSLEIIGNNGINKLTGTAFDDMLTGNGGNDILIGGAGNDILLGGIGADNQSGGLGDDVFKLGSVALAEFAAAELINGEAGNDVLQLTGANQSLNLTLIANNRITGIEILDLTGSGNNTLTLNLSDVLDLSFETNTLRVDGDAGDVVNSAGQGWTVGAEQLVGYTTYTFGAATLLIDTAITQTNVT